MRNGRSLSHRPYASQSALPRRHDLRLFTLLTFNTAASRPFGRGTYRQQIVVLRPPPTVADHLMGPCYEGVPAVVALDCLGPHPILSTKGLGCVLPGQFSFTNAGASSGSEDVRWPTGRLFISPSRLNRRMFSIEFLVINRHALRKVVHRRLSCFSSPRFARAQD
jgi:hypothetical protein